MKLSDRTGYGCGDVVALEAWREGYEDYDRYYGINQIYITTAYGTVFSFVKEMRKAYSDGRKMNTY